MADGYVGLLAVPDTAVVVPTIDNAFSLQVSEEIPVGALHSPLSSGKVAVSGLDVLTGHVYGVIVEEREHTTWPTSDPFLPTDWRLKGQHNVDWDIGTGFSKNAIVGGISAGLAGYGSGKAGTMHDFRVGFVNADNVLATLIKDDEGEIAGSFSGTNPAVFTRTAGTWVANEWVGRIANFKDVNGVTIIKRPVYEMTTTTLKIRDDGVVLTGVTKVEIEADNWMYDVGASGLGQEFNGINDFAEFAEVLNLEVDIDGVWSQSGTLKTLSAHLRWDNMYDHADILTHPHADGVSRDTVQAQWKSITRYVVFLFKSATGSAPANAYPDPTEANGEWFLVDEIEATHESAASQPKIEAYEECPAGATIAFWVGAATGVTRSVSEKNRSAKGGGAPPA